MKKSIFITFIILTSLKCFSQAAQHHQIVLKGTLLNLRTNAPIPYTSIGIPRTTYGTLSNTRGEYILKYPDSLSNVKIKVSRIGFADTLLDVRQLEKQEDTLYLRPVTVALKGVAVYPLKGKVQEMGRLKKRGMFWLNFGGGEKKIKTPEPGTEIAQKFKIKHSSARLSNLSFILYHSKSLNNIKLRLKIYDLQDNLPANLLSQKDIIINTGPGKQSVFNIDLKKYDLYVHSDIAVSLQLLSYDIANGNKDKNLTILIPARISLFHTAYGKKGSQDKWTDYKTMSISYKLKITY